MFGKRRTESSSFEWQLPGGWIEAGETPPQAARRELLEETGLCLIEPVFVGMSSNVFSVQQHSISLYFEAECADAGSLEIRETENCIAWEWRRWSELDENLYLPLRLFKSTGYQPFTAVRCPAHVGI